MYQISNSLNGGKLSALQKADSNGGICFLLGKYQPKIIRLCDWPFETKVFIVFDSLFRKFSLLSQKNSSLSFIVLPTTRKACSYWLVATLFLRCAQTSQSRLTKRALICYLLSYYQDTACIQE